MSEAKASSLISGFSENASITRKAAGTFVNGIYLEGASSNIDIIASFQPLNGREMLVLPDLFHGKEVYKMYTSTEIFTLDEGTGKKADLITFRGKTFEVQKVEKWEYDFSFFKALIVRLEQ